MREKKSSFKKLQNNYNEKKEKSQYFKEKFKKNLLEKLPKFIRAFKTKGKFNSKRKISAEIAVNNYKFIEYNREVCAFIILDIDHKRKDVWEIFEMLRERNILPTFFVYTTRGYQIGWELAHPFILNEKYQNATDKLNEKYAKYILKKLAYLLDGDFNAIRLKGIWRNPIKNKSKIYPNKKYLLNELDIFVKNIDEQIHRPDNFYFHINGNSIKNKVAQILLDRTNIKNIRIGERNSVLWYTGMFMTKELIKNSENKKEIHKKFSTVKNTLMELNAELKNPLSKKEVHSIIKSVHNYLKADSVYVSFGDARDWDKNTRKNYMRLYRKKKGLIKNTNEERKKEHFRKVLMILTNHNYKNMKEAIKKSGLGKTSFYKYYKIIKSNLKVLNLYKLLVNLQKVNTIKKENQISVSTLFSNLIFYTVLNFSSILSLKKLTDYDILFTKSCFIT